MPADPLRAPHDWLDQDAGPVVRPYAMTQGRVAPADDEFDLLAFVVASMPGQRSSAHLLPEHLAILERAARPISVAELAAAADLPAGVVRVLLDDLRARGAVMVRVPARRQQTPDLDLLKAVADGLRAL